MESIFTKLPKLLNPQTDQAPLGGSNLPIPSPTDSTLKVNTVHAPPLFPPDNLSSAADHASTTSSDPASFFAPLIGQLLSHVPTATPIDEASAIAHHKSYFDGPTPSEATNTGIGAAAAMQALKAFISTDGEQSQSRLVGLAMAQAAKLFDDAMRDRKAGGAEKEGSVLKAGEMVLRMYENAQRK
ncbi:hypothetical protein OQA88_3563 [Cercophora sp. LCS_1]